MDSVTRPEDSRMLAAPSGDYTGLAFAPDGQSLAVVTIKVRPRNDWTNSLKIWDLTTGAVSEPIKISEGVLVMAMAFAPKDNRFAFAHTVVGNATDVDLCDATTGARRAVIKGGAGPLAFSADGALLIGK